MPASDDSLPPEGRTLRRAFEALAAVLNERRVHYAIIGGLATIQHARVRTTDDIDVLLTVPQVALSGLFGALGERGFDVEPEKNIREFRDEGMTAIRFADVIVDLVRPIIPAYAHILDRAIEREIAGQTVRICSAEGLILLKLTSLRPQDEADIQDILAAYRAGLDLEFIRRELQTFTAAQDPRRAKFEEWARAAAEA